MYTIDMVLQFHGSRVIRKNTFKSSLRSDNEKGSTNTALDFSSRLRKWQFVKNNWAFLPHLAPKSPPYSSHVLVTVTTDNVMVSDPAPMLGSSVIFGKLRALTPHTSSYQACLAVHHQHSHVCPLPSVQPPSLVIFCRDHHNSPLNNFHPFPTPIYLSLCHYRECTKTQAGYLISYIHSSIPLCLQ